MKSPQILAAELRHIDMMILNIFSRPAGTWEKTDPQLERIEAQLKMILRDAQSQQSFAKLQKWNAAPGTPDRWSAQQKEKESREVIEQALALQKDVERLLGPNLMEIGKEGIENLEEMHKLQHELHGHQLHTGMHVPSYEPQVPGPHASGGDPMVAAVAWVILALESWKRYRERKDKARGIGRV